MRLNKVHSIFSINILRNNFGGRSGRNAYHTSCISHKIGGNSFDKLEKWVKSNAMIFNRNKNQVGICIQRETWLDNGTRHINSTLIINTFFHYI